jgi:membrane dipeptidase
VIATLSAAAAVRALHRSAAAQAVAKPSATGVDESKVKAAREVLRSTVVVDGLDGAALTASYLEMLKSGGVNCWHQSVGGLASFANLLMFLDQHSQTIVQAGTFRDGRWPIH